MLSKPQLTKSFQLCTDLCKLLHASKLFTVFEQFHFIGQNERASYSTDFTYWGFFETEAFLVRV